MDLQQLKYPIGEFKQPFQISDEQFEQYVQTIKAFPKKLSALVANLPDETLDTPYRPEGWTIRQVVHHCADSHMNGFIRLKLALSEDNPTIKPYEQASWAEMSDSKLPVDSALKIIEGVHLRWGDVLTHITLDDRNRTYFHPEYQKTIRLDQFTGSYAWHCSHHLAHVANLLARLRNENMGSV